MVVSTRTPCACCDSWLLGSSVCASPVIDEAHVLVESRHEEHLGVCLCVSNATQVSDGEWVRVVVAGYGAGWVRSSQVVHMIARSPTSSCLEALTLKHLPDDVDVLMELLAMLGAHLVALEATGNKRVDSDGMLRLLRACPRLKRLGVDNNGSFGADTVDTTIHDTLPMLEEQSLSLVHHRNDEEVAVVQVVRGLRRACTTSYLRRIQALTVTTSATLFIQCRDAVVDLLQAACWLENRSPPRCDARSAKRTGTAPNAPPSETCSVHRATRCSSLRLGLLCVVHTRSRRTPSSAVVRMQPDLLRLVFEFAASNRDLQVWIERWYFNTT